MDCKWSSRPSAFWSVETNVKWNSEFWRRRRKLTWPRQVWSVTQIIRKSQALSRSPFNQKPNGKCAVKTTLVYSEKGKRSEREKRVRREKLKISFHTVSGARSRVKLNDTERTVNDDEEHCETEEIIMKRKPLEGESNEPLNITTVINKQITKFVTPPCDLLHWQDMPQHLQFNPYVRKGKHAHNFSCIYKRKQQTCAFAKRRYSSHH